MEVEACPASTSLNTRPTGSQEKFSLQTSQSQQPGDDSINPASSANDEATVEGNGLPGKAERPFPNDDKGTIIVDWDGPNDLENPKKFVAIRIFFHT